MADKKISQLTGATTPLGGTEEVPLVQSGITKKVTVANLTVGREVSGTRFSATPTDLTATVYNRTSNNGGTLFVGRENSAGSAFGAEAYSSFLYSQGSYPVNIYVDSQKSLQLKDSTGNWDVAVLKGNLSIATSGKGIDFSANAAAPGATSELLDDYEIGTWTPVYQTTGTAFTSVTYTFQVGHYTKIGRQVTVSARIRTTALVAGLATGEVVISGLPFAPATSISVATGVVTGASGFAGDVPISGGSGNSVIYLYYRTSANGIDNALAPADMGTGAGGNDIAITITYFV